MQLFIADQRAPPKPLTPSSSASPLQCPLRFACLLCLMHGHLDAPIAAWRAVHGGTRRRCQKTATGGLHWRWRRRPSSSSWSRRGRQGPEHSWSRPPCVPLFERAAEALPRRRIAAHVRASTERSVIGYDHVHEPGGRPGGTLNGGMHAAHARCPIGFLSHRWVCVCVHSMLCSCCPCAQAEAGLVGLA